MTRVKKALLTDSMTIEDAEKAFAAYADADAKEKKIQADMDVKFTQIREKHQSELAALKEVKDKEF